MAATTTTPLCEIEDCGEIVLARGWCGKHYARWRRTGRLGLRSDKERFWDKVDLGGSAPPNPWIPLETECWLWVGSLTTAGYGIFGMQGKNWLSHRVAYTWLVGAIPEGMQIDHLCRVRHCVRPEHLDIVTGRVNTLRGDTIGAANSRKTHCNAGHPLSGDNLYMRTDRLGRECKTCRADAGRRYSLAQEGRG